MTPRERTSATPGAGQWVAVGGLLGPNDRVLVKLDGDYRVVGLLVLSEHLTSAMLRSIPLGKLEAAVRHPATSPRAAEREPLPESLQLDAAVGRVLDAGRPRRPSVPSGSRKRPRLTRPDGTDPEGFARLVAEAYQDAVLVTTKPAVLLAEEAGVPVTTVHRWVREARRRGFLRPARHGRAG